MFFIETIQKHATAFAIFIIVMVGIAFFLSTQNKVDSNNPILNRTWNLVSYYDNDSQSMIVKIENSEVTLDFGDTRLMGNGGCNSYSGEYELTKDKLQVKDIESTLMACDSTSNQEAKYLTNLANSKGIVLESDILKLLNDEGKVVLEFEASY